MDFSDNPNLQCVNNMDVRDIFTYSYVHKAYRFGVNPNTKEMDRCHQITFHWVEEMEYY